VSDADLDLARLADLAGLADLAQLPDLASRRLGGSVVYANDDLFAEKENLIKPGPPVHAAGEFGPRGKVYDGWETRRRREPGHDHAIVRLGVPGIVRGVVVDTSFFLGNYPPQVSVEAVNAAGYPGPAELAGLSWRTLVDRTAAAGGTANAYPVTDPFRCTHVRLSIYPDGGVARFRVHGEPVPDPDLLTGTIDLAALENGGRVTDCSDAFYAAAANLIMPGNAVSMADGWENARRRDDGQDFVTVALAAAGLVREVEIDTSYFVGNAPGWARLLGAGPPGSAAGGAAGPAGGGAAGPAGGGAWAELLPRTRLQPDTRHRFLVDSAAPVSQVRLEVFPDGGVARLRIRGEIGPEAITRLRERFSRSGPDGARPR
jgi:allantoicase